MNFYIDRKGLIKRFYVLLTYILLQIYVVFWQILEGKMNLCYITTILLNSGFISSGKEPHGDEKNEQRITSL